MKASPLCGFLALLLLPATDAVVVHNTTEVKTGGQIRMHYDDKTEGYANVIFLGVGTSMKVNDYDDLSSLLVENNQSTAVIIADPDPSWIVKTDPHNFAELANHVLQDPKQFLPHGWQQPAPGQIFVGGHSASGSAAYKAVTKGLFDFDPSGFIGLDPFLIKAEDSYVFPIPSLDWGFTTKTCGVTVDEAAKGVYDNSNDEIRVLFLAENDGGSSVLSHCSFTDHGCMGPVCPCHPDSDSFKAAVARGTTVFLNEVLGGSIHKEQYESVVDETTNFNLLLCTSSDDAPNGCSSLRFHPVEVKASSTFLTFR